MPTPFEQMNEEENAMLRTGALPSKNVLPQGSLQGTMTQPKQGSLLDFTKVMRTVSESVYKDRQKKEGKVLKGQFDPSKVSGSIFSQIMGAVESKRGKSASDIYSGAVEAAKFDIEKKEEERQFNESLAQKREEMYAQYPELNQGFSNIEGMRTDRHNNPTAFTVDIAKQAGLIEGVDYVVGDPFSSGGATLYTAKLLGNPIEITMNVIDKIGFYTQDGKPRWTYVDKLAGANNWQSLTFNEKANVVKQMYRFEGGNGSLFSLTANEQNLTKEQKSAVNTLSDDVRSDPEIKTFMEIRDGYERVATGAELGGKQAGAGDLAILFGYMKILDPTSVVRETEFANAESAMGYAQKVLNMPSKFFKGTRLTEEGRQFFSNSAKSLYERKKQSYDRAFEFYKNKAESYGLDPNLVLRNYGTTINQSSTSGSYTDADDAYVKQLGF